MDPMGQNGFSPEDRHTIEDNETPLKDTLSEGVFTVTSLPDA